MSVLHKRLYDHVARLGMSKPNRMQRFVRRPRWLVQFGKGSNYSGSVSVSLVRITKKTSAVSVLNDGGPYLENHCADRKECVAGVVLILSYTNIEAEAIRVCASTVY